MTVNSAFTSTDQNSLGHAEGAQQNHFKKALHSEDGTGNGHPKGMLMYI